MILAVYIASSCFHSFRFFEYNYIPILVPSRFVPSLNSSFLTYTNFTNNNTTNHTHHNFTDTTNTTLQSFIPGFFQSPSYYEKKFFSKNLNKSTGLKITQKTKADDYVNIYSPASSSITHTPTYLTPNLLTHPSNLTIILSCQKRLNPYVEKHKKVIYTIYYWLRVLLLHMFPCSSLVILNTILISSIRKAAKNRTRLLSKNHQKENDKLDDKETFIKKQHSKNLPQKQRRLGKIQKHEKMQNIEVETIETGIQNNKGERKDRRETKIDQTIIEDETVLEVDDKKVKQKPQISILQLLKRKEKKNIKKRTKNIKTSLMRRLSKKESVRKKSKTSPTKMLVVVVSLFLLAEVPLAVLFILYIVSNTIEVGGILSRCVMRLEIIFIIAFKMRKFEMF